MVKATLALLAAILMVEAPAGAQPFFEVTSAAGIPLDTVSVTLSFDNGGSSVDALEGELIYDSANLVADVSNCGGAANVLLPDVIMTCADNGTGTITFLGVSSTGATVASGTIGSIAFTIANPTTPGVPPDLSLPLDITGELFADGGPAVAAGTSTDGVIDVSAGAPPQVAGTYSVARPNGELTALTQIYVSFDEPVTGADDSASFQLVSGGADGIIDTTQCGPPGNDDTNIAIDSVNHNASDLTSYLAINGGLPLPRDRFLLLVCATIMDPQFNPLDGNGDGIRGDDYSELIQISVDHLLSNPNFDSNIDDWPVVDPIGGTVMFDPTDSDAAPTSGALRIADTSGTSGVWTASQCGDANQFDAQAIAIRTRILSADALSPMVSIGVEFFAATDCSGAALSTVNGSAVAGDTAGAWILLDDGLKHTDESQMVQSALFTISVDSASASSFEVLLDDAVFYRDGLFDDSFEDL